MAAKDALHQMEQMWEVFAENEEEMESIGHRFDKCLQNIDQT